MAAAPKPARARPRLYLATPPLADSAALAESLPPALAGIDIAVLLVRLAPADERTQINRIKTLAAPIQKLDIAVLVEADPSLAARGGAHGAPPVRPGRFKSAPPPPQARPYRRRWRAP